MITIDKETATTGIIMGLVGAVVMQVAPPIFKLAGKGLVGVGTSIKNLFNKEDKEGKKNKKDKKDE